MQRTNLDAFHHDAAFCGLRRPPARAAKVIALPRPRRLLIVLGVLALSLSACGRPPDVATSPDEAALESNAKHPTSNDVLGFPAFATKNTTRVAGTDPTSDAAGIARAVFSGSGTHQHPPVVTLADVHDWRSALAASALVAPPIRAPILFTDGDSLPDVTKSTLAALNPTGSAAAGGAQVIRIGTKAQLGSVKTTDVRASNPFAMARAIDAFASAVRGTTGARVLVVSADDPAFALPAAAWAAKSGDTVLFAHRDSLPADTVAAIKDHSSPHIYVLGPSSVISPKVTRLLRKLGPVTRTGGPDPESNSIEFARYLHGSFGWGIIDPGHGLVFARANTDPATAAAAAPLSSSGAYGPLLLLSNATALSKTMARYLLDIQPGYANDPVRGVYNRGWLVGDTTAITVPLQSEIDRYLEIVPVTTKG